MKEVLSDVERWRARGEKVAPKEVELVLMNIPGVKDHPRLVDLIQVKCLSLASCQIDLFNPAGGSKCAQLSHSAINVRTYHSASA